MSTGPSIFAATIPGQKQGAVIDYYILAENSQGLSATDPAMAPVETHSFAAGYQPAPLYINEFMADNATSLEDPDEPGEFPDWIELFNASSSPLNLGGKYLTDDLTEPTKFRIPDGITIPAGDFLVFFADGDPEQGPLHTTFRLSKGGEEIGLFDVDFSGNRPIDTYNFGLQGVDLSERRYPDGGQIWIIGRGPTAGASNVGPTHPQ